MDDTANLKLPYIVAAQAQKHVTHNEALRALDAIVQLMVLDKDLAAPPGSPAEGDRYIVAASPTGAWAGQAGKLAAFQDDAWAFYAPHEGWIAWIGDEAAPRAFDGSAWVAITGTTTTVNPVAMVGVNATADATNRLSVSSPASLFNHEGAGHQVKINKAAPADTASLLFQTGFSGRAEYGLAGDDDFHVKVSPDGSTWHEAIVVDKDTGEVSFPNTSLGGGGGGSGDLVAANNLSDVDDAKTSCDNLGVGLRKLASGTVTSAASLEIALPAGYRSYELRLSNFVPATDNVALNLRTSSNGGSSFDSGASDYQSVTFSPFASGAAATSSASTGGNALAAMSIAWVVGNETDEGCSVVVSILDPADTAAMTRFQWLGSGLNLSGNIVAHTGAGCRNAAADVDAVQLLFSSGNIASGKWTLYGYA
jgi:hypothetical protein